MEIVLVVIVALTLWAVTSTLLTAARDGFRRIPTDPRRLPARAVLPR